jgi:hypothetical protein
MELVNALCAMVIVAAAWVLTVKVIKLSPRRPRHLR